MFKDEARDATVIYFMDHSIRIGVFAFLSAVFAGLTLGVMCADTFTLEIIAESGSMPMCTYAAKILPLRKQGHKTLCTLIISNMLCNVLIVQEFSNLFDHPISASSDPADSKQYAVMKFAISTLFIVFFTELIPMSICKSKHSLRVAAAGSVFVKVAMIITYPISVPLGKLLDFLVGATESGQIYDKKELRRLMVLHYERDTDHMEMPQTELKLLLAAMDFQESRVADIMTPLESAVMVEETELVTEDFVELIWMSGRSRIPILSKSNHLHVKGVLMAKDLTGFRRFAKGTTVSDVVQSKRRVFAMVEDTTALPAMLKFFQDAKIHMAVVFSEVVSTPGEEGAHYADGTAPTALRKEVGLITLEDVVEKLLNDQIYDEYDRYNPDVRVRDSSVRISPNSLFHAMQAEPKKRPRVNFYSYFTHPDCAAPLTDDQLWGVAYYIHRAVKAFATWSPSAIHLLLKETGDLQLHPPPRSCSRVGSPVDASQEDGAKPSDSHMALRTNINHADLIYETDDQFLLYRRGVASDVFTLVLGGQVDLLVGFDCFHSSISSFDFIGEDALLSSFYTPDCTAVVQRPTRLFRIRRSSYERVSQAVSDTGMTVFSNHSSPLAMEPSSHGLTTHVSFAQHPFVGNYSSYGATEA